MKIQPVLNSVGYSTAVHVKKDGQSSQHHHSGSHGFSDEHSESFDESESDDTSDSQEIKKAIASFQEDPQTLSNGLNANMETDGPGLKVVLTDKEGLIIRQFSGEEFVKLREAVSSDGPTCGKILDRKL
jgi:hypothetical protein